MTRMKKRIVVVPILLLSGLLTSCFKVEEFGNAHYLDESQFADITNLMVGDTLYRRAGTPEDGFNEKDEYIAAFNDKDNYSTRIYTVKDYPGILYVKSSSVINMATIESIYASEDAVDIPASFLYDFPHHDTWMDGGKEAKIDGATYAIYGSSSADYVCGSLKTEYNGKSYYSVEGCDGWLSATNQYDAALQDFYYNVNTVETLPIKILFA